MSQPGLFTNETSCPIGRRDQSRARKQAGGLAIYHLVQSTRYGPLPDGRGSVGHSETLNSS